MPVAAIGFTQLGRALRIDTVLGPDVLLLRSISGQEAISQLFRFQLDLISETDDIAFDSIVGTKVTVHIQTIDSERVLSGIVSRFSQGGRDERFTYYRAEMVPWLWFLTRTADCRIFQQLSVPAILQKVLKDVGADFELRLFGSYAPRDYCVQYRETTFNFVSRLMEEEGIHYFFEHGPDKSTLILADADGSHKPCPGQAKARCDLDTSGRRGEDRVTQFQVEQEFRPGAWAHTDYNFETPGTSLMSRVRADRNPEIYDYPGFYSKPDEGSRLARIRLEETQSTKMRANGKSNCRCFSTGTEFELVDHYRQDLNEKWLLTSVQHHCTIGEAYGSGGTDEDFFYANQFECIPANVPFRPIQVTPRPIIQGLQTALVVGPRGEEIFSDKYGRVKVQFYWDRLGKKDENSSCWLRVSSVWAGTQWGAIHIPRIGQEVIVDFLEGDPDRPIITGRVYNAENMPPWALPANQTISGLKSRSSKGGGPANFNEISMEDKKGSELLLIHAERDQEIGVEHDENVWIGHNRTEIVDHDEAILIRHDKTETVDNNRTLTVHGYKTETVDKDKTISVHRNQTETIDGAVSLTIGKTLTELVAQNHAETVGGSMEITVGGTMAITTGGALTETVGGAKTESVGGNNSENIGGNKTLVVGKNFTVSIDGSETVSISKDLAEQISGNHAEEVQKNYELKAKKVQVSAEDEIHLKTGDAELIMKKNGNISIKGNKITIEGSGDVIIKGSKIKAN